MSRMLSKSLLFVSMSTFRPRCYGISNYLTYPVVSQYETKTNISFDAIPMNLITSSISQSYLNKTSNLLESFLDSLWNIKRTFQPSLLRRKRKHGFLARQQTKSGRHVLNHRRFKKRRSLCA